MTRQSTITSLTIANLIFASSICANSIRLFNEAEIAGDSVELSEIASLEGAGAEVYSDLVITQWPVGRESLTLKMSEVRESLTTAGVKWSEVSLVGQKQIELTKFDTQPNRRVTSGQVSQSNESVATTPESNQPLADLLRQKIESVSGFASDELDIQFVGRADEAAWLNRPTGSARYELHSLSKTGLGRVPIVVTAYTPNGETEKQTINAEVGRRVRVAVATQQIRRGDRFEASNVAMREIIITSDPGPLAEDQTLVIGRIADASVSEGSPIRLNQVKNETLIRRGELVTVTVVHGRLVVRTVARAKEDAAEGEMLQLQNEVTREQFYATATGPRQATISDRRSDAVVKSD
jgi:flagella basal body P-ring formation protein FlgA